MALGVRVVWPRLQLEALGTVWLSQQVLLAGSASGAGGDVSLATGALRACVQTLGSARSEISSAVCAGAEIGRRAGTGLGVQRPLEAHALWLAPNLDLGLSWRVPRSNLSLGASVGAAAPLERQRFLLDGLGQVHQPAALAARAALSLDVAWE
ncbi:MAG TPA: hypothetical protein VG963_22605 [Polyangiaceae bacterium]|nr:hypothetical protein [Polyangiaceae bacterium]